MKNLILFLALFLFSLACYSQVKITGFGKFQLGMSVKDIPELAKAKRITNRSEYLDEVHDNETKRAYEIVADSNDRYSRGIFDSRVRAFQIGRYFITENIELKDIELKFFNDKLYSIHSKDLKITDMIDIKYGKGKLTVKEEEKNYVNGYGNKIVKKDEWFTTTWETGDPDVSCTNVLYTWHDRTGQKSTLYYTELSNTTISIDVMQVDKDARNRFAKLEADKKKANLDGF